MLLVLTFLTLVSALKFRFSRGVGNQGIFKVHFRDMDFNTLDRAEAIECMNAFTRVDFVKGITFTYGMVEANCPSHGSYHANRFAREVSNLHQYDHESMSLGHLAFNSLPFESRQCVFAVAYVTILGNGTALLQKYGKSQDFLVYKASTKERFSSSRKEEWTDKPAVSVNLKILDTVIIYTGGPLDVSKFKRLRSVPIYEAFARSIRGPVCLIGLEIGMATSS